MYQTHIQTKIKIEKSFTLIPFVGNSYLLKNNRNSKCSHFYEPLMNYFFLLLFSKKDIFIETQVSFRVQHCEDFKCEDRKCACPIVFK